jgi:hypothetical protein
MKRTILALLATATFAAAATIASAQQDPINSAPRYSPSATGATPDTPAKITDGINSAPNYNPATAAATPATAKRHAASAKSAAGQHASHRHHKHHTPAS